MAPLTVKGYELLRKGLSEMRNYSKVYLNINNRLNPIAASMTRIRVNKLSIADVYFIPRDAKMAGL